MHPFEQYELRSVLHEQPTRIQARIDKFTDDEVMANDLKILVHNVCEEFRIDPLELYGEDAERRAVRNGKIQKWFDWIKSRLYEGNDLRASEVEIVRAAVRIGKDTSVD